MRFTNLERGVNRIALPGAEMVGGSPSVGVSTGSGGISVGEPDGVLDGAVSDGFVMNFAQSFGGRGSWKSTCGND